MTLVHWGPFPQWHTLVVLVDVVVAVVVLRFGCYLCKLHVCAHCTAAAAPGALVPTCCKRYRMELTVLNVKDNIGR